MNRAGLRWLAAAGLLVLSGCSGDSGDAGSIPKLSVSGAPGTEASGSAPSSGGPEGQTGSAPAVADPIDAAAVAGDPCAALGSSQLSRLGLGQGKPDSSGAGPGCSWEYTAEDSNQIDFTLMQANKNGLSDIYDQQSGQSKFEYFEPTEVAGHPAVYASVADLRTEGNCSLHVGLNDQTTALVASQFLDGPDVSNPCPVVADVAQAMIETLRG